MSMSLLDQQRVLQKFKHVVELTEGSLVFTVQESMEPQNSSIITVSQEIVATAKVSMKSLSNVAYAKYRIVCLFQFLISFNPMNLFTVFLNIADLCVQL